MDEKNVTISVDVLNKVFNVLGQLPYQQVAGLVQEVHQDVQSKNAQPELKAVGDD